MTTTTRRLRTVIFWGVTLRLALALCACGGSSIVQRGSSRLRAAVTGQRTWSFDCDPAADNPPNAPPIDLAPQRVTFQCRSANGAATLALTLQWTPGGYGGYNPTGRQGPYQPGTSNLQVMLLEAMESGDVATRITVASLRSFSQGAFVGHSVSGSFEVQGDITGSGEFDLVAR